VLAADEHLNADPGGVEADGILHVHRDLLVGQFLQDARAAAGAQHHRPLRLSRDYAAQDAAGAEQRVAMRQ